MRIELAAVLVTVGLLTVGAFFLTGCNAIKVWAPMVNWNDVLYTTALFIVFALVMTGIVNLVQRLITSTEEKKCSVMDGFAAFFDPLFSLSRGIWKHGITILTIAIVVFILVSTSIGAIRGLSEYQRAKTVMSDFYVEVATAVGSIQYENSTLKEKLDETAITIENMQAVQDGLKQQIAELTRDNAAMKETIRIAAAAGIKVPDHLNPQKPGQK